MVKVYCLLVLPDSRRQSNNTLDYQKSQRKQPFPPSGMMHQPTKLWGAFSQLPANGAPRSVQPRLVLLGVPGVVSSDVDGLEKRLSEEVRERQRLELIKYRDRASPIIIIIIIIIIFFKLFYTF